MPRLCSTEGSIYFSLHTASFNFVKSINSHTVSSFLTTIAEHQSVWFSTLLMTPIRTMHRSSYWTLYKSNDGILLCVFREKGTTSALSLIAYGCQRSPKPLHNFGYFYFIISVLMLSIFVTRSRLVMTGLPSRAVCNPNPIRHKSFPVNTDARNTLLSLVFSCTFLT